MTGHGSSKLDEAGTAANEQKFGVRFVRIADGSLGGPDPTRRYGVGTMAIPGKKRKR